MLLSGAFGEREQRTADVGRRGNAQHSIMAFTTVHIANIDHDYRPNLLPAIPCPHAPPVTLTSHTSSPVLPRNDYDFYSTPYLLRFQLDVLATYIDGNQVWQREDAS